MPRCPICGSDMRFDRRIRMYVCKNCGLTISRFELDLLRDMEYERRESEMVSTADEYLEWWKSRKEGGR